MESVESAPPKFTYVLDEPMRILVTDDDPIMREFASVYLSAPNVSVETAENGALGLARLIAEPFDFSLVDLDMPVMGGLEMIRHVREIDRLAWLPIMVVTSNEDIVSIDAAYKVGATTFATKPVNWRLMTYQIRYVLRSHRLLRPVAARTA